MNQKDRDERLKQLIEFSDDPNSSNLGFNNSRVAGLPKNNGNSFRPKNTEQHTYHDLGNSKDDLRVAALFDFWAFIELIKMHGGHKSFSDPLHPEMCRFVSEAQLIDCNSRAHLGLIPRGHYKSTLGTVGYALWRIYRNPNIRIIVGTATKELAQQFVILIKQYLENDNLQKEVWNERPHIDGYLVPIKDKAAFSRREQIKSMELITEALDKKIIWRADSIQVVRTLIAKEPTVMAASPQTNVTGQHYDLGILDDILNDETVNTPEKREKTRRYAADLESVIDPARSMPFGDSNQYNEIVGDEIVVWGTRYHAEDYYQHLINNLDDFDYKLMFRNVYKNGKDSSEGYLFPEKFNDKMLSKKRKRQGLIVWSAQYLNKVITSEEVIFEKERIRYMVPGNIFDYELGNLQLKFSRGRNGDGNDEIVKIKLFCTIDIASTAKKKSNYSSIAIGGLDENRALYLVDLRYGKWLPAELIKNTYDLLNKWQLNSFKMDCTGNQILMKNLFTSNFHLYRPVSIIPVRFAEQTKEDRIKFYLQPLFSNSMIYLMAWMKNKQEFLDDLYLFPGCGHDDILDSMAMLVEAATPAKKQNNKKNYIKDNNVIQVGNSFYANRQYGGRRRW